MTNAEQYAIAGLRGAAPIYRIAFSPYEPDAIVRLVFADGSTFDYTRQDEDFAKQRRLTIVTGREPRGTR